MDTRYALRVLGSRPLSTGVIALTLGIGVGAATTTYGVMRRLLLQAPPHVVEPDRIAQLYFEDHRPDGTAYTSDQAGYPFYEVVRDNGAGLAEVAAFGAVEEVAIGAGATAVRARTQVVSPGFWRVLGIAPALGRLFLDQETSPTSGERVIVVSHALWQRHFGGNPDVVGMTLQIRGLGYQIVGVAPQGFRGLGLSSADLWFPLFARTDLDRRRARWYTYPDSRELHLVVRRRAGVSAARAAAVLSNLYNGFVATTSPRQAAQRRPTVILHGIAGVLTREMKRAPEGIVSVWLVGVAFVLLAVSCANVGGLLLIRALRRRGEIAMRLALGMSRGRLLSLLLTESTLLALAGGLVAAFVVVWGRRWVWHVLFPQLPLDDLPFDWRVLRVAAGCTTGTALLTGLVPVLQARHYALGVPRSASIDAVRRPLAQGIIVVVQAALSVVLLTGAGLFVRSLWRVTTQDLGLEPRNVLAVQVDFVGSGQSRTRIAGFYERALEAVRAVPGVEHATIAVSTPLRGALGDRVRLPGAANWLGGTDGTVRSNVVADEFFSTTGMTLVQGHEVVANDRTGTRKVVINEALAREGWSGRSPIGACVYLESTPDACATVIGVSKNARSFSVTRESEYPWLYQVLRTGDSTGAFLRSLLVRVSPGTAGVESAVRTRLLELEPGLPYVDIRRLEDDIEPEVRPWRTGATVYSALGIVAALLAALGIYAAVAWNVTARTREIGVRMATGATAADVFRLVVRDGLRVAGVGIGVGIAVAVIAGHWLGSLLFETSTLDPMVFAGVVTTILVVTGLATVVPARRAARLSPLIALQTDP